MLYPQSNPYRQCTSLSGLWDFRFDPDDSGEAAGWAAGLPSARPIAVPASWNDQLAEGRDYLGRAWYQTRFDLPWGWSERRVRLRFGSVNYLADVWLNGAHLGRHEGGHLPFEFDVSGHLQPEGNRLVVRVDGELAPDRVPPGNVPPEGASFVPARSYPDTAFDFFPFCGIQRPVLLYALPHEGIDDLTVASEFGGSEGRLHVRVAHGAGGRATLRLCLRGHGAVLELETADRAATLAVPHAAPWAPGSPNLYELTVELRRGGAVLDRYTLPVGPRTVSVEGDRLLLNGQPLVLKGFGRHEDFPVAGRGLVPAVAVKDSALMQWIGANSFRTSHYPYAEETMDLADRLGLLVIDETPAVGLSFGDAGQARRLALCRQYVQELIARDKNHPSVIMWSLANEPQSTHEDAGPFFRELYELAKALDPTRPVAVVSMLGAAEEAFEFCDVLCLNRYCGWYSEPGQLEQGLARLAAELDGLHQLYPKPLILSEFGADAVAGHHALEPAMFSEEYQADMLARCIALVDSRPFVVGQHVWNLCDFQTAQAVHRVGGMNLKGVFTRDRRPKLAAWRLRELWRR